MFNRRAQSTAEYAIIIGLVVSAVLAMQVYVKRSMQGTIKYGVDKAKWRTGQYEPYYLSSDYTTTSLASEMTEEHNAQGITRTIEKGEGKEEKSTRSGSQTIGAPENN